MGQRDTRLALGDLRALAFGLKPEPQPYGATEAGTTMLGHHRSRTGATESALG